jgi:hypothetical protein
LIITNTEIVPKNNKPFSVKPKLIVFTLLFMALYCFGFVISIVTNFTFRAALLSLLVVPLLLIYRIRPDKFLLLFALLVIVVLLSAILNGSSPTNVVLFLRIGVFAYLVYILVSITMTSELLKKIIKISVWISMIQLPIMLLQWQLYDKLPLRLRGPASLVDFGSGTFTYKTDYAMVFFLTILVVFLLFEEKRNFFIKNRMFKVLWLSLTILVANAQIMKIALILVWLIFLFNKVNIKKIALIFIAVVLMSGVVLLLINQGLITEEITTFVENLTNPGDVNTYLSGGYSRTAALKYLFGEGFSWLGAGPGAFSDPLTKTLFRGNTGHSFTFLSEIGLIGWLTSVIILFLIAFPIHQGKIKINWTRILMFASIFLLSFTANVMNDISVFLFFCIMCRYGLIEPRYNRKCNEPIIESPKSGSFQTAKREFHTPEVR